MDFRYDIFKFFCQRNDGLRKLFPIIVATQKRKLKGGSSRVAHIVYALIECAPRYEAQGLYI